ncbi:MAG: translation initiation factor eIF-1A [Candidatus Aenigmarchaeota archaeon]|nr:translation initiation factor eIF-1A [Candidatus Aenigmarchaeota archaeon]
MAYYKRPQDTGEVTRARVPKDGEVLGVIESKLGFGRTNVVCSDKKIRICAVPGKYKRRIWLHIGDIVLVTPWEFGGDKKGHIIYKYRKGQVNWLKTNKYLDELDV